MQERRSFARRFIQKKEAGVLCLLAAMAAALAWANSPWGGAYEQFWALTFPGGAFTLRHFVNDVLMAFFFVMVGCELKRERLEGELVSWSQARLPVIAAVGGMVVPALLFLLTVFALGGGVEAGGALRGWAIPTATDIAFALGVFSFLGPYVPVSLRTFLLALATMDDMGSVLLIGLFYSSGLNIGAVAALLLLVFALWGVNKKGVTNIVPYALLGGLLWFAVFFSGIHATLAGLLWAFLLPLRRQGLHHKSLLREVENGLHPWVSFFVLPVFAFANAGVSLQGATWETFADPLLAGIMVGLLLGKPLGVIGSAWLAIRGGFCQRPTDASWRQIGGVGFLCGIGFTMSLFIGTLAFEDATSLAATRAGILSGSTLAAAIGYLVLLRSGKKAG